MKDKNPRPQAEEEGADYAPKPLTTAQNVILTLKVLACGGALFLLLWLVERSKN